MKRILCALFALLWAIPLAEAMTQSSIPTKVPTSWGTSAPGSNITCPMPVPSQISITPGRASWTDGFPPLTFQPSGSGGIPPFGADFNGVLCQISQWTRWYNASAPIVYDPTFQTAIGGYPKGAVLPQAATLGCYWVSQVDNNLSDPDTGGANWLNTCTMGGALTGSYPNPSLAASGVTAGTYARPVSVTVTSGGTVSAITAGSLPTCAILAPSSLGYTSNCATTIGASGSFSTPSGATRLEIQMVGGGGGAGGSGSGATGGNGANGGSTSFNSVIANGGNGGATNNGSTGGAGGAVSGNGTGTADVRVQGAAGTHGQTEATFAGVGYPALSGAHGAGSCLGDGAPSPDWSSRGTDATTPGAGGSGASTSSSTAGGGTGAGGAGECVWLSINNPSGSYSYTVGAAGTAGTAGTGGFQGGAGGPGLIQIKVLYN